MNQHSRLLMNWLNETLIDVWFFSLSVCVCLLSSCYKLLISENHSVVKTSSCYEMDTKLLSLLHLPVKDPQDYYSLGDITANGQSLDGRILNVLAAVMSVS